MYKYKANDTFITKNNKIGTIIKIAQIDEFGADFYFAEKNYVVTFEDDTLQCASYNFIKSFDPISYNYVMTEDDMMKIE
jgi:hypothetical protein